MDLLRTISSPTKFSEKFGKLFIGKHNKLKSEFSVVRFNLFSLLRSNLISEVAEIFLKISYNIAAEVVVLPSLVILISEISS